MANTTVHIINHTHWDREWFLSSIYTTHWIPTLIDRLLEISADNPDFRYLLDGQTLIIEDLLKAYPDYRAKVAQLVENGNLTIGPYYCQPDWKLTCGESLIRNLEFGRKDAAQFGGTTQIGWMVDTFGHISQSPQIHKAFNISAGFVWRGVPVLEPYFTWQGADGTTMFGVDLFGGYRNLYGVTHAPDVAARRLQFEIEKLSPYYPTEDIPLFDGYDLEDNPEDSVTFLTGMVQNDDWNLLEATPESFVTAVQPKLSNLPTISGELNSGKFGAVFPGVYSSRTYNRILNRDCATLLYRWAEPLGVMAWTKGRPYNADQYEAWSRLLLQNDVHDVTCGVSIDQVHEKAEDIYRQLFDGVTADVTHSLNTILTGFAPGRYALSANPMAATSYTLHDGHLYTVETNGIGVTQLEAGEPISKLGHEITTFQWENEHYGKITVQSDGTITLPNSALGKLVVSRDEGDCYSDETKEALGELRPSSPLILESSSSKHATLSLAYQFETDTIHIEAAARLILDDGPLLRWEIDLDSTGTDFRVEMIFETGQTGPVMAGMPFDVVARPFADTDLFPRDVGEKAKIFMGQRELNEIRSFPFHDFVGLNGEAGSAVVFAKGINSYRAFEDGRLAITLRRSGEWVTRSNLENRVGDAGPFFYVPDARCERTIKHEVAFSLSPFAADSLQIQQRNASYQTPPLFVEWTGEGEQTEWPFLQKETPLSSLQLINKQVTARWYNPTNETAVDVAPKKIVSQALKFTAANPAPQNTSTSNVRILNGLSMACRAKQRASRPRTNHQTSSAGRPKRSPIC